jgi:ATP-dependent Clp protease, protease subunit
MAIQTYRISAKGSEAEIYLYGDVGESWFGGVTAKQFADDMKALGSVGTINLRINSAGGDVFDGLAMYRLLVEHKARVVSHIDGLAASIASVIAMAGDEIRMSESAQMMVHNAWGLAMGDAETMRTMAGLLDTTSNSIRDVYAARTGKPSGDIKSLMDAETWMTAAQAVDLGFADSVSENLRIAAHFDPLKHKFRNAPKTLTATPNADAMRDRLAQMKAKMIRHRAA